MAIRKINGAFAGEIVMLFIKDILKLVVIAAGVVSVTLLIIATVVLNCLAAASENPVKHIS